MTSAEKILWEHLRKNKISGVKFRRQYPKQTYILDFYSPQTKIAIEVDGGIHGSKGSMRRDGERSRNLQEWGVTVIRFSNDEIMEDVSAVVRKIEKELQRRADPPSP